MPALDKSMALRQARVVVEITAEYGVVTGVAVGWSVGTVVTLIMFPASAIAVTDVLNVMGLGAVKDCCIATGSVEEP